MLNLPDRMCRLVNKNIKESTNEMVFRRIVDSILSVRPEIEPVLSELAGFDKATFLHKMRVAEVAAQTIYGIAYEVTLPFPHEEITKLIPFMYEAGATHDWGKMGIENSETNILEASQKALYPETLAGEKPTDEQLSKIDAHPEIGAFMINAFYKKLHLPTGERDFLHKIARNHHQKTKDYKQLYHQREHEEYLPKLPFETFVHLVFVLSDVAVSIIEPRPYRSNTKQETEAEKKARYIQILTAECTDSLINRIFEGSDKTVNNVEFKKSLVSNVLLSIESIKAQMSTNECDISQILPITPPSKATIIPDLTRGYWKSHPAQS